MHREAQVRRGRCHPAVTLRVKYRFTRVIIPGTCFAGGTFGMSLVRATFRHFELNSMKHTYVTTPGGDSAKFVRGGLKFETFYFEN